MLWPLGGWWALLAGSCCTLLRRFNHEACVLCRYVGMTWTSFAALARLSVPTVTVLKNLTNLFVIVGAPLWPFPARLFVGSRRAHASAILCLLLLSLAPSSAAVAHLVKQSDDWHVAYHSTGCCLPLVGFRTPQAATP